MSVDVSEIMLAVKNRIEEAGALKEVRIMENQIVFGNLLDAVSDLTAYPAVVVCGGEMLMKNGGMTCEVMLDIIFINQFFDIPEKNVESKRIMSQIRDLFTPGADGRLFSIGENHFMVRGIDNMKLSLEHMAWKIKLTVFASF